MKALADGIRDCFRKQSRELVTVYLISARLEV